MKPHRLSPNRIPAAAAALFLLTSAALLLFSCETLDSVSQIGTDIAVAAGRLDASHAESINRSARAVAKSFEDITPEQEYYIGRSVGAVVLADYRPYDAAAVNEYLNLLGQALALASDRPETFGGYRFLAIDSEEINAFAAPSGHIFVSRGLLRCARNEAEVAAILAHEIGHVQHRHGLRSIKQSRVTTALTSVALTSVAIAGPDEIAELTAAFDDSITDITESLITNGYSRAFEKEADAAAVAILQRTGYDPAALIRMLKVMDDRLDPAGNDFAKTHPDPDERITEIRELLADSPSADSADFEPAARTERFRAALKDI